MNHLDPWRARQAAMLHHYTSLAYLQEARDASAAWDAGRIGPAMELARSLGEDMSRWNSMPAAAGGSYGVPGLTETLSAALAERRIGRYRPTGVYQLLLGLDHKGWQYAAGPLGDRDEFLAQAIHRHASNLDDTLNTQTVGRWDDFDFTCSLDSFARRSPRMPRFVVRPEITARSGEIPPRTGVYVCTDDPNAAVQFASTGTSPIPLRLASTFNEVGLAAVAAVGREALWFDEEAMYRFAVASRFASALRADILWRDAQEPELAPSAIARNAFVGRPATWHFVEIVEEDAVDTLPVWPARETLRLRGGERCPRPGYYFSPFRPVSRRHFALGEELPRFVTRHGETTWLFDGDENP